MVYGRGLHGQPDGIVNGITEKEFAPLNSVTREQMCTMLVRYAEHVGVELQKDVP